MDLSPFITPMLFFIESSFGTEDLYSDRKKASFRLLTQNLQEGARIEKLFKVDLMRISTNITLKG